MNDESRADLFKLAESITDEVRVDWGSLHTEGAASDAGLQELRMLEAIALAHRQAGGFEAPAPAPAGILFRWGVLGVVEKLGEGGFGEVYRAWDPALRREVALKLRRADAGEGESARRWLDEARRLARVRHPGVLVIHGAAVVDGRAGFWTDLLEGETLEAWLSERGPCSAREAARLGAELCRALAAVHTAGLVHADVKTTNVMRESSGRVVLMDFGSSLEHVAGGGGSSLGTPLAMAPEVLGGAPPSPASDLYSLGVLLYRLVTARFPIEAGSVAELRERLSSWKAAPLRDARPELPEGFAGVVERALEAQASRRFETAGEMERALEAFLAELERPGSTTSPVATNLPAVLSSFIGREREVDDLRRLLEHHRLVTLTGTGGCGKTRLALRVAESERARVGTPAATTPAPVSDGVWFVGLAALLDPRHLPSVAAAALGVRERGDVPPVRNLVEHLGDRRALVVLDNCEHLVAAAAEFARELLEQCPGLTLIATSRQPLGIPGEALFPVMPLTVPDRTEGSDVEAATRHASVRLFVDRANESGALLTLAPENVAAVAGICRRVEGIPLALELAAARVRVLAPSEIVALLDRQPGLLSSEAAGTEPRHRTLKATILWSVDLLTEDQRRAFRSLAVFVGGWTLKSAAAVVEDIGDELTALDRIGALVDRSLVVAEPAGGATMRYRFLEPIRQCALELLAASGGEPSARERHVGFFLELAREAHEHLEGSQQRQWLDRLETEHENLLSALEWCARSPDRAETAQQLAGSLARFWSVHGHASLGGAALERVLALPGGDRPTLARAQAVYYAGVLLSSNSKTQDRVGVLYEEALGLFRALGDRAAAARCLSGLAATAGARGDHAQAEVWLEEAEALLEGTGDRLALASALHNRGVTVWNQGDLARARPLIESCAAMVRELGDLHRLIHASVALTFLATRLGDRDGASAHAAEALGNAKELRARSAPAAGALLASAELSVALDRHALAAVLFGAASRVLEDLGLVFDSTDLWWSEHDRCVAEIRSALGQEGWDRLWIEGRALSCEAALERAAQEFDAVPE